MPRINVPFRTFQLGIRMVGLFRCNSLHFAAANTSWIMYVFNFHIMSSIGWQQFFSLHVLMNSCWRIRSLVTGNCDGTIRLTDILFRPKECRRWKADPSRIEVVRHCLCLLMLVGGHKLWCLFFLSCIFVDRSCLLRRNIVLLFACCRCNIVDAWWDWRFGVFRSEFCFNTISTIHTSILRIDLTHSNRNCCIPGMIPFQSTAWW